MSGSSNVLAENLPITNQISNQKYLWLIAAGHFTTDFYNGFLAPLLPIIVTKLNLSLTLTGLLLSIFSISNSLTQPIAGLIDDRLNRNYFVLFGPLITAIFMGLLGWANQYWTLLVILIMSGIGTSMFHPPGAALIGALKNNRKGFAMSIFNTAGAFGIAVGSLFIIPFTNRFGLKATIFTVLPAIVLFIYSSNYLWGAKVFQVTSTNSSSALAAIKPHAFLLLNLFLIVVIRATTVVSFSGFIPLYLNSQGNSVVFGGIALAIFQLFTTAGILIGGHLFDRIGAKKLLTLSFVFILPLALAFINLPSIWGLPFLAIMAFLLSSATPVNIILGQQIVPTQAGLMSSIMMGLSWGAAGLLMTPIGVLADAIGLYRTLTLVSGLSVIGLMLVYFFRYEEIGEW